MLTISITKFKETKSVKNMLIVGQLNDEEEQYEIRFIAQISSIGERVRYLARQQRKK